MYKLYTITICLLGQIVWPTLSISLRANGGVHEKMNHQYWFNKDHPNLSGDDDKWNYCDYKCLSFEKLVSNKDFVVVQFSAVLKQDFTACYVKAGNTYTLWSKVTENKFYQKLCGQDYKDWMADGGFDVTGIYGVGIGGKLNQTEMYIKK